MLLGGCQKHLVHEEKMIAPNGVMSKMKGDEMPPAMAAPMPSGWRGFRPY